MILCGIYYGIVDDVQLLVSVQFFKINQYLLMDIFYFAFIARLQNQTQLLTRLGRGWGW